MRTYKRSFSNYFIDKRFQSKYLLMTILLLLTFTFIFTIILFSPSIMTLFFDHPLAEKNDAARAFLVLHSSVWPAISIVILIFGILSIFLSHKVAGPVYRLKHALTEMINGNLNTRIRLRKWDDLQELAEQVNLFSDKLHNYVTSLKKDHEQLLIYINQLEKEINTDTGKEIIGLIKAQKIIITERLERFKS